MTARVPISDMEIIARIERAEVATKRSKLFLLVGLAAIIAGFITLTFYLNYAKQEAERARDEAMSIALSQSRNANVAANTLEAVRGALIAGRVPRALELLQIAARQQEQVAEAPMPATAATRPDFPAPVPAEQPQIARALRDATSDSPNLSLPSFAGAQEHRIFIQFAGSIPRREIVVLNQALRDAGWDVQGASGERIASAVGLNEVRFSGPEDEPAADALSAALTRAHVSSQPVRKKQLSIIRPSTLEVWISR